MSIRNTYKISVQFFILFLLGVLYSCSSKSISKTQLIGSWELIEVNGKTEFPTTSSPFRNHYLIFTQDSITSLEQPCYFLDQGTYTLHKNQLNFQFGSWQQTNTITLSDTLLNLSRNQDNRTYTYTYTKVTNYDTINRYRNPAKGIWQNPSCFTNTHWTLKARKRIPNSNFKTDTLFTPPTTITINEKCGWEICILRIPSNNSWINLYALEYNGKQMDFIPYTPFGEYHAISDTVYTYELVQH